ncbi:hypothetical protein NDU88_007738, partial [Pleurodeles waltl]
NRTLLPSDSEVLGLRRGPFLDAAERAEGPREYRVVAPSSRPRTGERRSSSTPAGTAHRSSPAPGVQQSQPSGSRGQRLGACSGEERRLPGVEARRLSLQRGWRPRGRGSTTHCCSLG